MHNINYELDISLIMLCLLIYAINTSNNVFVSIVFSHFTDVRTTKWAKGLDYGLHKQNYSLLFFTIFIFKIFIIFIQRYIHFR